MVAAGILLSRIVGLVRKRVFAHYFGTSDAADAFNAALPHPQLPAEPLRRRRALRLVHPGLRRPACAEDDEEAGRVAGAVAALLALVVVGAGAGRACCSTPWLIDVIAPGFEGEKRDADHPAGADPLPGRRAAGALRLVPGRPQQPPPLLPLLRGAGGRGTWRSSPRWWCSGGGRAQYRPGRRSRPGDRWWAACCSSRVQLPTVLRLLDGHPAAPRSRARAACARCSATSVRCSSAAAWCRSAPTWTRSSPACSRPARSPRSPTRRDLHAAGEPLRDVGVRRGAAGDVGRDRHEARSVRRS